VSSAALLAHANSDAHIGAVCAMYIKHNTLEAGNGVWEGNVHY